MMSSSRKKSRHVKSVSINYDEDGKEVRRGPWTVDEDNLLIQHITSHGEGQWNSLAKSAGLKRTGKSCRLRWLNYLKPDTIRGNLTPHEQLLILELHSRWGNRWSKIAQQLPGRTDNEIKNYWRTRVQKQARQLKVDSNSNKFLEAVRLYWMPRLREKMEQSTSSSSATSSPSSSTSTSTSETPNVTVAAPTPLQINGPVVPPAPPKSNGAAIDISDGVGIQEISGFLTSFDRDGCCMQELGCGGASTSECNVAGVDWLMEEGENSFWNSYELWH